VFVGEREREGDLLKALHSSLDDFQFIDVKMSMWETFPNIPYQKDLNENM